MIREKPVLPDFMKRMDGWCVDNGELNPVVRYWILHLLVPLGGMREFISRHGGFTDTNLALALGLISDEDDDQEDERTRKDMLKQMRNLYRESQQMGSAEKLPATFSNNIRKVSELVGLSDIERQLLEFAAILKLDSRLCDAANCLGDISSTKTFMVLSSLLGINEHEIRQALQPSGLLARSNLVTIDRRGSDTLSRKIDLLSDAFADVLFSTESEPIELLRDTVTKARVSNISIESYSQIRQHLDILIPYLRHCLSRQKAGVNILFYGPPGVGKTQLTRVLAGETDTELFEISSENMDGEPVEGNRRLAAFRAAQCFLSGRQSFLVFDEAEDIFASGGFFSPRSIADKHKAWMNKMLEENPVPTFWLSNDIHDLDPAFLRRFDMALEVGWPTRSQRREFLQKQCGDFIEPSMIERIAATDNIAPAVTERAIAVMRAVKDELPPEQVAAGLELLVNDTLTSQRHRKIASHNPNKVPDLYNPAFINADKDMNRICQGLSAKSSARICLYGPPGTGKTAFGKYLAETLDKPLLVRRASDLLSMWVGGTEKNIARAFEEATQEEAILLIDEVDSFLQDRRGAQRSWEVTAVNEMLTQMETFNGIFIASTNLMSGLDQASLRRFDLKVKFDYLQSEQAWQLFCRHCERLDLPVDDSLQRQLAHLPNLTPGDFAAVARQNTFSPLETASDLLHALIDESGVKENAPGKSIGFIRH